MSMGEQAVIEKNKRAVAKQNPFRRAILGGLGVLLPPLLTVVFFLWCWNLISRYVFEPIESATQTAIVWYLWDMRTEPPAAPESAKYVRLDTRQWIPRQIYEEVNDNPGDDPPQSARAYFDRYVRIHYLKRSRVIPVFLAAFVLVLYLLGKFLAVGMGRWLWARSEALIQRVPLVRNVYSAVKQVTDFVFKEQTVEFNRVVAVEYPRKGMWSIGFVTGEGMLNVRSAVAEPIVTLLLPTSPIPGTGFTVTVPKSDTIELDITVDQAIQFIVSCGVVIPPQQLYREDGQGGIAPALLAPPAENDPPAVAVNDRRNPAREGRSPA